MKRYLLLLLVAISLIGIVSAGVNLDFQQPEDFALQIQRAMWVGSGGGVFVWVENASGGNSYFGGYAAQTDDTAAPMTYAAATCPVSSDVIGVELADESKTVRASFHSIGIHQWDRIEMKMIGGRAYILVDGVESGYSGILAENPTYVTWTGNYFDDTIWGSNVPRYIFGMPDQGYYTGKQYFIMRDIMNPAASGFYRRNTTDPNGDPSLISSFSFVSTFGKNNGDNETVTFSSPNGGTQLIYNTGTRYAGIIYWNLTDFFDRDPRYGLYQTTIEDQINSDGFAVSEWIPYIASGASIEFDKNSYAVGETATLSVGISDSYYDTDIYAYHVVIQDIYGTEKYDEPISFSTLSPYVGSAQYTWADGDDEGVYFGLIYAKRISDDEELLMNYDTADLNSNLVVTGYVKDAETTNVIVNATVNVTQGVASESLSSGSDGLYTTTAAFLANMPTTITASKTGYETYTHVFTPLYAGAIQINLTLMPTNPTYTGIALGGIARTPPYNRTIDSATVYITNASDGHSYTATTNSVGYYIQNDMAGTSHWFDIWGSRIGFSNSSIYQKLVFGS